MRASQMSIDRAAGSSQEYITARILRPSKESQRLLTVFEQSTPEGGAKHNLFACCITITHTLQMEQGCSDLQEENEEEHLPVSVTVPCLADRYQYTALEHSSLHI